MTARTFRYAWVVFVALAVVRVSAGGWAVVTVKELPAYVVAGTPISLTFAVRAHGQRLSDRLSGFVEAQLGSLSARAVTHPLGRGQYSATLTLPQAGEWQITINSGYSTNGGGVVRFPISVVDDDRAGTVPKAAAQGRQLFVTKGCLTCHVHSSVSSNHPSPVGPVLTGKRYQPDHLRRLLADPSILPGAPVETSEGPSRWKMPDLDLAPAEIEALVAFINNDRQGERASGAGH